MNDISLYLHIPYCRSKCGYCDFCSFPSLERIDGYFTELSKRITELSEKVKEREVASVYFGGGTPTVAGAKRLCGLLDQIISRFKIGEECEITLETNPATVTAEELKDLKKHGFNRLSAGIQTARQTELSSLMRTSHTVSDGPVLVENARAAGFDNINLDLMYGIPGQTADSFSESIDFVLSLCPEHISSYALKLEAGTPLYLKRASLDLPDDDTTADMYLLLNEKLQENGYFRYEISNFAKPGYESRHNLRYWRGGDYAGIGLSAASLFGNKRYIQSGTMEEFIAGKAPELEEELDENGIFFEFVMLNLRLREGINKAEMRSRFGVDFDKEYKNVAEKYEKGGFAVNTYDNFYLTDKGSLISNTVINDFLK